MNKKALKALTTDRELKEVQAIGHEHIKLQYIGQMEWSKEFGIDSRMWNLISPRLSNYDYSAGGYPTFTIEGLKERGII